MNRLYSTIILVAIVFASGRVYSKCTTEELSKLRESGFSTDRIRDMCDIGGSKSADLPPIPDTTESLAQCKSRVQNETLAKYDACIHEYRNEFEEFQADCNEDVNECRDSQMIYSAQECNNNYFECQEENQEYLDEGLEECEEDRVYILDHLNRGDYCK